MATTLLKELFAVRKALGYPLDNEPSLKQIIYEMQSEHQNLTNETNNTGQSWQVSEYILSSVVDQREYEITVPFGDFYKALTVTTVPDNSTTPEYPVYFVEREHISNEWPWLSSSGGQLFWSSHDSSFISFYRKIGANTAKLYAELRPVPSKVQDYRILYMQTDWWEQAILLQTSQLPHSSQRFYIQALVARNLILAGVVKWSYDSEANAYKARHVLQGLKEKIERYKKAYDDYKASLDIPGVTMAESWAPDLW